MSQRVLIVGANCSIGRGLIADLKDKKYTVVGTTTQHDKCVEFSNNLGIEFQYLDVAQESSVKDLFKFQPVFDAVVYLASKHYFNSLRNFSVEKAQNTIRINALGLASVAKSFYFSVSRAESKIRSIVYVSSVAAHLPEIGLLDYSVSKCLGNDIARNIALELSQMKIRINSVSPGWVDSERSQAVSSILNPEKVDEITSSYPFGIGRVGDVSNAIQYFISDQTNWVTGQDLVLDGGKCLR